MNPTTPVRRHFLGLAGLATTAAALAPRDATARATPDARTPRAMIRLGGDLPISRLGYGADHRPGHLGRTRRRAHLPRRAAPRDRSRRRLHRHRERLQPPGQRAADREALHPYPKALVIATRAATRARPRPLGPTAGQNRCCICGLRRQPAAPEAGAYRPVPAARGGPQGPFTRTRSGELREAAAGGQIRHRHLERAAPNTSTRRARWSRWSLRHRTATTYSTAAPTRCSPAASSTACIFIPGHRSAARGRDSPPQRWHR